METMDITNEADATKWTDQEWEKFAKWLRGMLEVSDVTVTFTKKDGTEREMICTLNPDVIPKKEITEGKKERKKSENTMVVYDVVANDWRSFTIKSVKQVQFQIGS